MPSGPEALYLIPCGAIWGLWQFFFLQFDSTEVRDLGAKALGFRI